MFTSEKIRQLRSNQSVIALAEQIAFFVFSFITYRFFNAQVSVTGENSKIVGCVLIALILGEHLAARAMIHYANAVKSERTSVFFARTRGTFLLVVLYSLHAFAIIALFTGVLSSFYSDMNLIPDWYIGLGGTLLLLKDIPLFYSLKKVPSTRSSEAHVDTGVPFFHRAILVSVSIVLMLVLWEKSTELRIGNTDTTARIALAVLYTFLYWATRIPALVVDICEARNYKLLQIAISYIAVLIFQMLMLY